MADPQDVAEPVDSILDRHPMRDEDGNIRSDFVDLVSDAGQRDDSEFLSEIVSELHEADVGDRARQD